MVSQPPDASGAGAGNVVNASTVMIANEPISNQDVERLAAEAGVTPVTYASGKSKAVAFRWACNHRLRAAITCLADNSRHASAWAASIYNAARARGCDHPHAIRVLARAWLRVIWRAWQDRATYDPQRHAGAMLQLAASGG